MENKLNFIKKCYDQYLITFVLSFVLCFTVVFLNCVAFSGAKNGVPSLFETYYHEQKASLSSNRNPKDNLHHNSSNPSTVETYNRSTVDHCLGHYIYVYDLPRQFNDELLSECQAIVKWRDLCPFVANSGLGPKVEDSRGILSNDGWYNTNQFFLGPIVRARMKQYRCLTDNYSLASAIYVPFYPGIDVYRHLYGFNISVRDALAGELVRWVRSRPEWRRLWGRDHFMVSGRISWDLHRSRDIDSEWGNNFLNLPELKNMTFMTIETAQWSNEFGVPYPTYFHPSTIDEVSRWQEMMRKRERKYLFSFAGGPRPNLKESIRSELIRQCTRASAKSRANSCFLLACSMGNDNKCKDPVEIINTFRDSVFCLQPPGDSYTRRSAFDSILAGCIPVFFHPGSFYGQYLWYFPRNYTKYSVFIPEKDVRSRKVNIRRTLRRIPRGEVRAMREEVIRMIPRIVYANPTNGKLADFEDAFDVAIERVLERIENVRTRVSRGEDPSVGFSDWEGSKFDLPLLAQGK